MYNRPKEVELLGESIQIHQPVFGKNDMCILRPSQQGEATQGTIAPIGSSCEAIQWIAYRSNGEIADWMNKQLGKSSFTISMTTRACEIKLLSLIKPEVVMPSPGGWAKVANRSTCFQY